MTVESPLRLTLPQIVARDIANDAEAGPGHLASSLKAGATSAGGVAVAGFEGYLFIGDGANRWERQFLGELTVDPSWLTAWNRLLERRQAEAAKRDVLLWNFVAPEKQAVLPRMRWREPKPESGRRPLMQLLATVGPELRLFYPQAALVAGAGRSVMYHRHNSHWTPSGCITAVLALLEAMAVEIAPDKLVFDYDPTPCHHDLTVHLFDPPPSEACGHLVPMGEEVFNNRVYQTTGRFTGSSYGLRNPAAADPRRVSSSETASLTTRASPPRCRRCSSRRCSCGPSP